MSAYFTHFVPELAGIVTARSTNPASQDNVAGSPTTAGFIDSVHSRALETEAETVVLAPDLTAAGSIFKCKTIGLAAANDA